MRGKVGVYIDDKTVQRITPAYAGKRLSFSTRISTMKDHPRVCGEKRIVGHIKPN